MNTDLQMQMYKLRHEENLKRAEQERLANAVQVAKRTSPLAQLGRLMVTLGEQLQERYDETRTAGEIPAQRVSAEA